MWSCQFSSCMSTDSKMVCHETCLKWTKTHKVHFPDILYANMPIYSESLQFILLKKITDFCQKLTAKNTAEKT